MEKRINLLPQDMTTSGAAQKLKKVADNLAVLSTTALFVSIFVFVGLYIYNSNKLKLLRQSNEGLKTQVVALEGSEQKLVLAKDRLGRIKDIMEGNSAVDEIALYKELTQDMDPSLQISEVGLESSKLETSVLSPQSKALGSFFKQITDLTTVKKVVLSSLTFNPSSGYLAGLIFTTGGEDE